MKKDKDYLYNMYNATSTAASPGEDELETYENWLERQLLARMERIKVLEEKTTGPLTDIDKAIGADLVRDAKKAAKLAEHDPQKVFNVKALSLKSFLDTFCFIRLDHNQPFNYSFLFQGLNIKKLPELEGYKYLNLEIEETTDKTRIDITRYYFYEIIYYDNLAYTLKLKESGLIE